MSTPSSEPWTIRRIVRWSAEDFGKRGLDSPRLDAELLVAHALGVDRVRLYMDLERELTAAELQSVRELVQRRRKREPVAYLLGRKEFWGRSFAVSRAVLVPRPDTETLVERALAILTGSDANAGVDVVATQAEPVAGLETHVEPEREEAESSEVEASEAEASEVEEPPGLAGPGVAPPVRPAELPDAGRGGAESAAGTRPVRVLDLGTGSGAIGLTIACEVPGSCVTITDVSAAALEVARANLTSLAVGDPTLLERVRVLEGDLFAPLPREDRFELIVSNPPYLAERELAECDADVREHEPTLALVAGPRGDETIVRLLAGAARAVAPGGTLLVEIGSTQGPHVRRLFEGAGLGGVRLHRDLGGCDRVVEGRVLGPRERPTGRGEDAVERLRVVHPGDDEPPVSG
jgi:release factor glutamine methyltransferase